MQMTIGSVAEEHDIIWFYDNNMMSICQAHKNFDGIEMVAKIDEDEIKNFGSCIEIFCMDKKLYLTFHRVHDILIYNIVEKKYRIVRYVDNTNEYLKNAIIFERKIVFFDHEITGKMVIFDTEKEEYEEHIWTGKECIEAGWKSPYIHQCQEKVYFPIYTKDVFLELDLYSHQVRMRLYRGLSLASMCVTEEAMWMTQTNTEEIAFVENKETHHFKKYNCDIKTNECFSKIFAINDKVIAIPRFGKYIFIFEKSDGLISRVNVEMEEDITSTTSSCTYGYYIDNDVLYLLPWRYGELLCLDLKDNSLSKKCMNVSNYLDYCGNVFFDEKNETRLAEYLYWVCHR